MNRREILAHNARVEVRRAWLDIAKRRRAEAATRAASGVEWSPLPVARHCKSRWLALVWLAVVLLFCAVVKADPPEPPRVPTCLKVESVKPRVFRSPESFRGRTGIEATLSFHADDFDGGNPYLLWMVGRLGDDLHGDWRIVDISVQSLPPGKPEKEVEVYLWEGERDFALLRDFKTEVVDPIRGAPCRVVVLIAARTREAEQGVKAAIERTAGSLDVFVRPVREGLP